MKSKLFIILFFLILPHLYSYEKTSNEISITLSEKLISQGFELRKYTYKTITDKDGYVSTYIGFTMNKKSFDLILTAFDEQSGILFERDEVYFFNSQINRENMLYTYYCYVENISEDLIDHIVIGID